MQIFFPRPSMTGSVAVLDNRRLVNQIVRECKTLINGGWENHPVSKLWRGRELALCAYALFGLDEIKRRGLCADTIGEHYEWWGDKARRLDYTLPTAAPDICYTPEFQMSHRSNLLRKDPEWYGKFDDFKNIPDNLDYIWNDHDLELARISGLYEVPE